MHSCPSRQLSSPPHTSLHSTPGVQHCSPAQNEGDWHSTHGTPPVAPQKRGSSVMHCPGWPGPCSQQPSGQEIASQTQRPLTQWLPPSSVRHDWQTAPLMPHTPLSVPGWQKSFASQQPAQHDPPGP